MSTVQPAPYGQPDLSLYPADHTTAFKFLNFIFSEGYWVIIYLTYLDVGCRECLLRRSIDLAMSGGCANHVINLISTFILCLLTLPDCS